MRVKLKDNKLLRLFKKLWVINFTSYPYKIVSFEKLYQPDTGALIDVPESLSALIDKQEGELIVYHLKPVSLNKAVNFRLVGNSFRYLPVAIFKAPDRCVYSLSNGCLIGSLGLVYDGDKRAFIAESAKEWHVNLQYSVYTNMVHYPPKIILNGVTLSMLTNGANGGFYHFLLESIIKLECCKKLIDEIDHFLFNGPPTQWKIKWLNRIGIDLAKVIWVDNSDHYECTQLIFTNRLIKDQQISEWCILALRRLFKVKMPAIDRNRKRKVVWITRKGLEARHIVWEHMIFDILTEIEPVDLSGLNCEETISTLQAASHVIAPHGAGLSNIYLCNPGTKILEIYPEDITFQPCYQRIAILSHLEHAILYLNFNDYSDTQLGLTSSVRLLKDFIC